MYTDYIDLYIIARELVARIDDNAPKNSHMFLAQQWPQLLLMFLLPLLTMTVTLAHDSCQLLLLLSLLLAPPLTLVIALATATPPHLV